MNYVDNPFKSSLTSISIGPGIRGIERGVERVIGLEHLAYVEIEAFIIENLVAQMERGVLAPAVIWSDVKTLPCEPFRGITDILLAGYPCQPFSTAGKRKGTEDPRHLYPYIERAIRIIRPRICFFENVRGHVTSGLPEVIASLEGLGYRVHWGIYSAEETGAAHKRERVFILAIMDDPESRRRLRESVYHWPIYRQVNTPCNTGELGNTELQSIDTRIGRIRGKSNSTGTELADSNGDESERDGRSGGVENPQGQDQSEDDQRQRLRDAAGTGGETMGYTNNPGLQGRISEECGERSGERATRKNGPFFRVSGPGEPQQTWEHPRVISRKTESLVGLSAHGYHFREDILRALGNSVYEDTAELAFRHLARKHGITV